MTNTLFNNINSVGVCHRSVRANQPAARVRIPLFIVEIVSILVLLECEYEYEKSLGSAHIILTLIYKE